MQKNLKKLFLITLIVSGLFFIKYTNKIALADSPPFVPLPERPGNTTISNGYYSTNFTSQESNRWYGHTRGGSIDYTSTGLKMSGGSESHEFPLLVTATGPGWLENTIFPSSGDVRIEYNWNNQGVSNPTDGAYGTGFAIYTCDLRVISYMGQVNGVESFFEFSTADKAYMDHTPIHEGSHWLTVDYLADQNKYIFHLDGQFKTEQEIAGRPCFASVGDPTTQPWPGQFQKINSYGIRTYSLTYNSHDTQCLYVTFSGSPIPGNTVNVTAQIRNFSPNTVPYEWVSYSFGPGVFGTPNGTVDANREYSITTSYTVPTDHPEITSDTISFRLNGEIHTACANHRVDFQKVTLQFEDFDIPASKTYNVAEGQTRTVSLRVIPERFSGLYQISLNCNTTKFTCRFLSNNSTVISTNLSGTTSLNINITGVSSTNGSSFSLTANGVDASNPGNIAVNASDTANVVVTGKVNLAFVYKLTTKSYNSNNTYCTAPASEVNATNLNVGANPFNYAILRPDTSVVFSGNTSSTPPSLDIGSYQYRGTLGGSYYSDKEIKYVKTNTCTSGSEAAFTINNGHINSGADYVIEILVGPKNYTSWFNALGGSIYSKNSLISRIPSTASTRKILEDAINTASGVLSTGENIDSGLGGKADSHVENYDISLQDIDVLFNKVSSSNITPISESSIEQDSYNDTESKFYYLNKSGGNWMLDTNINANGKVAVVFVNGSVVIKRKDSSNNDINNVDLIIVSNKSIRVEGDPAPTDEPADIPLNTAGALLAKENVFLERKVLGTNTSPIEVFNYRPEIFFSTDANALHFKESPIYSVIID